MRRDNEDHHKNELAKRIQKRQIILERIEELHNKLIEYSEWVQNAISIGTPKIDFHKIDQGKKYYREHIAEQKFLLNRVEAEIEQAKLLLLEAMRERKVMEKLKDNDFEAYKEAFNKDEVKIIEEIVNYKNNKSRGDV